MLSNKKLRRLLLPMGAAPAVGGMVVIGAAPTAAATPATPNKWTTTSVTGVSGRHAGMTGTVQWRIAGMTDPSYPIEEHVALYGAGPLA